MEKIKLEDYEKLTRYADIIEEVEFTKIEEINAPETQFIP